MSNAVSILPEVAKESIIISGMVFHIHSAMTADQVEAAGRKNSARNMRENGITRELIASRGTGTRLYMIVEFQSGLYRGWERSVA